MKRFGIPLAALCAAALIGAASHDAVAPVGIAFVNINLILSTMPEYMSKDSILSREVLTFKQTLAKVQDSLQSAGAALDQKSIQFTPVQREAEAKKLQAAFVKLQGTADSLERVAAQRRDELLGPIEDRVTAIITVIRSEGNYAAIFNLSAQPNNILDADKTLNITDRVIARLKP